MGRYWNTERFGGKFGFACQASDDPEYFGMLEDPEITYDATEETKDTCKMRLDENYDLLKIPKEERCYYVEDQDQLVDYYSKCLKYAFVKDKNGKYLVGEDVCRERYDGADLAIDRVFLGLAILSEATDDNYFTLQAER